MEGIIDLRFCKEGDILITSQGLKMKYLEPTLAGHFYDHHVQYLDGQYKGSLGTRTHSGHVMKFNRKPEIDNDIVKVIKKSEYENMVK
jgi:hypothetical protein|tara:strand:- start:53 stop:316 length:264 start_codon:yes stop_codon:yes gene_type:complete